jgi:HlyD family secretion protein
MKKFRIVAVVIVVLALAAAAYYYFAMRNKASAQGVYQTVVAEKGSLSATVGATGIVRSNQSAQLAWQTTGTVDKTNVKLGDSVKTGDVLAMLLMTSLPQNVILAEADLQSAQQALEDLKNSTTAQAQAEQTLAKAQKAFDDAKDKYEGINFARASDTYIKNLQAQVDLANQQVARARRFYAMFATLPNGDSRKAQAIAALTSAELARDDLVANLNYVTGKPDANDAAQRKANYVVAQANLEDAQRTLERLKDGVDPLALASAEARVTAAQATINTARISAPFNGVITQVEPLPGDQVSPGKLAFRLDDLSHLLVDVDVSEIDINSLKLGQKVTVTFDAVLGKTYTGTVVEVSHIGATIQGAVNFTVTVELTDADESVKPGMTAAVTILVKELNDVLLVPNRAVRVVDGQRVVYILRNGQPAMVEIRLGSTSDVNSEILEGDFAAGDLIILNPPATMGPGGPMGGGQPGGN